MIRRRFRLFLPLDMPHRRCALLLAVAVIFALLFVYGQPLPALSAEPVLMTPQAGLAAPGVPVIFTVNQCPPTYEKSLYAPGQVVCLSGTGFEPYQWLSWQIWGTAGSCDPNVVVAHSLMTADANGSFCFDLYTVPNHDCGRYRITVNAVYSTYYEVLPPGPTATPTITNTPRPTATSIYVPTQYTINGYVYDENGLLDTPPPAEGMLPLGNVRVELYAGDRKIWNLVDQTETTQNGWFSLSYVTDAANVYLRVVETDPRGYKSVAAYKPPLYGRVVDPNTIELSIPYARNPGAMFFVDRRAPATPTPTETPTITGTPPTPTDTPTPFAPEDIFTRVLQQGVDGYMGVEDTYITEWFLRANYSRYNMMSLRNGNQMSPLIRYDLSFIPSNAVVLSAKLSLYAASAGPHPMRAELYRVFRPWDIDTVNWLMATASYGWAAPGCTKGGADRAADSADQAQLTETGRWYEFDLTGMAQDWVASTPANQGVILKAYGDIAVQWNFIASEHWRVEYRPKLTITYAITGPTPTMTPTHRPTATPTDTATPTNTPRPFPLNN